MKTKTIDYVKVYCGKKVEAITYTVLPAYNITMITNKITLFSKLKFIFQIL